MGWKSGSEMMPAFGDWECVNQLPITQYFESASQAVLLRSRHHTSSHQAGRRLEDGGGHNWQEEGGRREREKKRNAGRVTMHQLHDEVPWSKHESAAALRKQQGQQQQQRRRRRRRPRLAAAGTGGGGRTKVFDLDVVTVAEQQLFPPSFSSHASDSCSNRRRHPRHQLADGKGKKRVEDAIVLHPPRTRRCPKAVDEDLYKISPHLLHSTHPKTKKKKKKKSKLGFICSCFLRPCAA